MSGKDDFEDKRASSRKLTKRKVFKITSVVVVALLILTSLPQILFTTFAPPGPPPLPEPRGNSGYEDFYYFAGGMVNTANGNLYLTHKDISIKGRGFNIEMIRSYNSQQRQDVFSQNEFGNSWTCNYFIHLEEDKQTGDVTLTEGDGSVYVYTALGGGNYSAASGKHGRLNQNADRSFILRFLDGSKYNFKSTGELQNITDKNGNKLTFTYTGGKLTKVQDDSGMYLNITVQGNEIISIFDPIDRMITYTYFQGKLINVTDAMGNSTLYSYNANGIIESVINRVGWRLNFTYEYDSYTQTYRVKDIYNSMWNYTSQSAYNSFKMYSFTYYDYETTPSGPQPGPLSNPDPYNDIYFNTNITDARGYTTEVYTNSFGNPLEIKDPTGNYTWTKWDSDFNIISSTDKNNKTHDYSYYTYNQPDSSQKTWGLKKVTDPIGNYTEYGREIKNTADEFVSLLKNVTNKRGYKTSYTYDSNYNLLNTTDARGNTSYITYDSYGNMLSAKDFRGFTTSYSYDTHGNTLNVTDPGGNVTKYRYDGVSRLKNVTNARGYVISTYSYDNNNRIVKVTDAMGNSILRGYDAEGLLRNIKDANGHYTNYTYNNSVGKREKIIDATGNVTIYDYDKNGNLIGLTNARGYTTSYEYDSLNHLIKIIDARGNYTSYTYDANGNLMTTTNRRGYTTTYEYDALNRITKVTDSLGNSTEYTYDEEGNLKTLKNTRGYTTTYYYDELDRLIKVKDALNHNTTHTYDENGNKKTEINSIGNTKTYIYDSKNRLTKIINALGHAKIFKQDAAGNPKNYSDANGNIYTYEYDALNRLYTVTTPTNNITYRKYDAEGNLLNFTDAKGNKIKYAYDELNRLIKVTTATSNTTTIYRNEMGKIIKRIDANGNITSYEYDELDRLILISYPNGNNITVEYDAEDNIIQLINNGGFGETTYYTYDALGRIISVKVDFGTFNKTINYTYDEVGNRKTMTDPNGKSTIYNYDAVNRLINLTSSGNITAFQYDNAGRRIRTDYPKGVYTLYSFDEVDRVVNITIKNSSGVVLLKYAYIYDNAGNILNMTENDVNYTLYEYNSVNRLINVTYPSGDYVQYTYDGNHNRLTETNSTATTNYTYDSDNRLLSRDEINYSYDNNSNRIRKGNATTYYDYDFENRLVKVTLPNLSSIKYEYSAQGKKLKRTNKTETTIYLYDFNDVLMELDENGQTKATFTSTPFAHISMIRNGTILYYHYDKKGSVTAMTDSNEDIVNRYKYNAFGFITEEKETSKNPYKFLGLEFDDETEIYLDEVVLQGKYYDYQIGWGHFDNGDLDAITFPHKDLIIKIIDTIADYAGKGSETIRTMVDYVDKDTITSYIVEGGSPTQQSNDAFVGNSLAKGVEVSSDNGEIHVQLTRVDSWGPQEATLNSESLYNYLVGVNADWETKNPTVPVGFRLTGKFENGDPFYNEEHSNNEKYQEGGTTFGLLTLCDYVRPNGNDYERVLYVKLEGYTTAEYVLIDENAVHWCTVTITIGP